MKFNFIVFFWVSLFFVFLAEAQIFQQLPGQMHEMYDRFEQINSEPPSQPNVQDLLAQAQNLVNNNNNPRTNTPKMNILEPPKMNSLRDNLSFLAKNNEINKDQINPENENVNKNKENENGIVIDGEKYEYEELKEIIEFNKQLVKLCKVDFSNCFDIKKSILPGNKVLSLLTTEENKKENEKNEGKKEKEEDELNEPGVGSIGGFGISDIDEKLEDDMIDLGLK